MTTDNQVSRAIGSMRVEDHDPLTAETVNEFCRGLGISRSSAYRLASRGELRLVKLGSRTLVPLSERARILAGRPLTDDAPVGSHH